VPDDREQPFPNAMLELLLPITGAVLAHAAVLSGGIVLPERLEWLRGIDEPVKNLPLLSAYLLREIWPDPATIFLGSALWILGAALLAYLAVRRLLSPLAASVLMAAVLMAGYPGWSDLLPSPFMFWVMPAALAMYALAITLGRSFIPIRDWINRQTKHSLVRVAWVVLMVFMLFLVAERVRLAHRGSRGGEFPYAQAGLERGFDSSLEMLRRVRHVSQFVRVARALQEAGLQMDSPKHCVYAHGAAARFMCQTNFCWVAPVDPGQNNRYLRMSGWRLADRPTGDFKLLSPQTAETAIAPETNSGGLYYLRFYSRVNNGPQTYWLAQRDSFPQSAAIEIEIRGETLARALNRHLWVEVETHDPTDVRIRIAFNNHELTPTMLTMNAGDREIVRADALLAHDTSENFLPLAIDIEAPHGVLDADVMLSPATPAQLVND